jgi:hypothetical protein
MKQNVHVVFRSANRERDHAVILGNSCEVGPQARLKVLRNGIAAIFGAEDHMDVVPGKCMSQCVAPPGLYAIASWLPTAATTPACTKAAQAGDPGSAVATLFRPWRDCRMRLGMTASVVSVSGENERGTHTLRAACGAPPLGGIPRTASGAKSALRPANSSGAQTARCAGMMVAGRF